MKQKKLLVSLSCGHTVVLDRREAAQLTNPALGSGGNHVECRKCPWNAPPRRVTERSWVTDSGGNGG